VGLKVVYKITYPNEDTSAWISPNDINYFGSAAGRLMAADFTRKQRRDFTVRHETL